MSKRLTRPADQVLIVRATCRAHITPMPRPCASCDGSRTHYAGDFSNRLQGPAPGWRSLSQRAVPSFFGHAFKTHELNGTHHNERYDASDFTGLNQNRANATAFRGRPGIPGAVVRTGRAINARLIASYRLRRLQLAVAPLHTPVGGAVAGDTGRDASRPAARG